MALLDAILGLTGQADPRLRMAQAFGQAPGGPGNPGGPQPLAGPQPAAGGPPGGGAGAGPPTGAAPAGPPQGPPAAPPQPQAYTSPPDLVGMYMQLAQRQQASQNFDRHLGMMAAAMYPGRRPDIIMQGMAGNQQDAGELFGNILRLQQYAQNQQNYQALREAIPGMLRQAGLDQSYAPLALANPDFLAKVVEAQTGVSGDPVQRELAQSRRDWHNANPGKSEADMIAAKPELAGPVEFVAGKTAATNEAAAKAKDLAADQHSFTDANADYMQTEQMLGWLKDHPEATVAAVHAGSMATGRMGQLGQAAGILPADTATAAGYLAQLQGKLYSEGWKGRGGRLSQLEAGKISEGFSQLNNPALPDDQINRQIGTLYDKTVKAHANTYGLAGIPTPTDLYGQMDDAYKSGGKLYNGANPLTTGGGIGAFGGPAAPAGGGQAQLKPMSAETKKAAQDLLAKDPSQRDALIAHLREQGVDPTGL